MKKLAYIFISLIFFLSSSNFLVAETSDKTLKNAEYYSKLTPLKQHKKINSEVIRQLNIQHYNKFKIDDELSSKMFDKYLSNIDPNKNYLQLSDINKFEKYRYKLDNALKSNKISYAFEIYNIYQKKKIERLIFILNLLKKGIEDLNFDLDENLEIDRKDKNWAATTEELNQLWRKHLKNSVLNLKLTDKPLDEIAKLLKKRYENQLSRVKQVNSEDVFQVYINSFAQIYDPHTQYLSPRTSENFNINMSLSLEGIGAVLQRENEYTKVIRLVTAGPADKAGELKPADLIVGVGQGKKGEIVDIIGWRLDEVVDLIRGPKETIVRLNIKPANAEDINQTKIISIKRNTVKLEEQSAKKKILELTYNDKKYKIGVIDIPTFYMDFKAYQLGDANYRSTTRDVRRIINELKDQKIDGIIVDLRGNGGGSLQEANTLTGLFIKDGPIVQVRHSNGHIEILNDPDPKILYNGPMTVLINRLSASASEIFAGAMQDYRRGLVLGEQTFGKGTVQSIIPLNKGYLKATIAKFYRVSGDSTQHRGVIPDINYPSLYNKDEIGESSLPDAMKWDKIKPIRFKAYSKPLNNIVKNIKIQHNIRIKKNPDYDYLLARIDRLKEIQAKNTISINEKIRIEEKKQLEEWKLEVENKRRIAKNMPPIKDLKELEEKSEDKETDANHSNDDILNEEDDFLLTESGYILLDLFSLDPG